MAASSSITTFNYSPAAVPIFEGENYDFWSTQMRTFFISQDLWDLVENSYESSQNQEEYSAWSEARKKKLKEHEMKDAKALYYIQQAIGKIISPRIMTATKSKEAWEILKNEFQGSENVIAVKLQTLWREFDNLMMKEGESIQNFFSRVFTIINQIRNCGDTIQDKNVVEKVLKSLPIKYDHVVAAIEESKNLSTLSLHELMGSLQAHEERMNGCSEQPLEKDFQTKMNMLENKDGEKKKQNQGNQFQRAQSNHGHGRGGNKYTQWNARGISKSESCCKFCKKTNHESMDCYFKKCTRCKNPNHLEKDCWFRKNDEAKIPEKGESSNQLFHPCINTQQVAQDVWYIDSRCSNHMMGNKSSFASLDEGVNSKVKLGDGKFQNIERKGTIAVQTKGAMEASTSSEVNSQIPANFFIPPFVPSEAEVELAISGLTNFLQSEAGSEVGSLPLISSLDGSGNLQSVEGMTFLKAFELMDRVKPLQGLVRAAATNTNMWEAFLNVPEVRIFLQQLGTGINRAVTIMSNNPQMLGGSSNQQQSSAQQESFNSSRWEKIFSEFIRIGKSIFMAFKFFRKDYYGNQLTRDGNRPTSEDYTSSGDFKDEFSEEYLVLVFVLSILLKLSILVLRRYA